MGLDRHRGGTCTEGRGLGGGGENLGLNLILNPLSEQCGGNQLSAESGPAAEKVPTPGVQEHCILSEEEGGSSQGGSWGPEGPGSHKSERKLPEEVDTGQWNVWSSSVCPIHPTTHPSIHNPFILS